MFDVLSKTNNDNKGTVIGPQLLAKAVVVSLPNNFFSFLCVCVNFDLSFSYTCNYLGSGINKYINE